MRARITNFAIPTKLWWTSHKHAHPLIMMTWRVLEGRIQIQVAKISVSCVEGTGKQATPTRPFLGGELYGPSYTQAPANHLECGQIPRLSTYYF